MLELLCLVKSFVNSFVVRIGLKNFLAIAVVLIDCVRVAQRILLVTIAQPLPAGLTPLIDLAFSVIFTSFASIVLSVQSFPVSEW